MGAYVTATRPGEAHHALPGSRGRALAPTPSPSAIALCRGVVGAPPRGAPAARAAGRPDPVSAATLVAVARRASPATSRSNPSDRIAPLATAAADRDVRQGTRPARPAGWLSLAGRTWRDHGARTYPRGINVGGVGENQ